MEEGLKPIIAKNSWTWAHFPWITLWKRNSFIRVWRSSEGDILRNFYSLFSLFGNPEKCLLCRLFSIFLLKTSLLSGAASLLSNFLRYLRGFLNNSIHYLYNKVLVFSSFKMKEYALSHWDPKDESIIIELSNRPQIYSHFSYFFI